MPFIYLALGIALALLLRRFGTRRFHGDRPASPRSAMTAEEARAVLDLHHGATPEEVREAHRRLMQKLHPDAGGSGYLARKVNEARDALLGE